jgi:hypothetical protein
MTAHAYAFEQPHERRSRLFELGLTEELVRGVVERGLAARRTCTAFDTPSFPGFLQWAMMHRASRELLARHEWTPDDSRNFSRVVRPDGAVALTVATGDEYTGRKSESGLPEPSTKYPKGSETDLAIVANVQLSLWEEPVSEEEVQLAPPQPTRQTWWLLCAVVDGELRYELSCPDGQDDRGYIVSWSERIIFEPIPVAGGDDDDDDPGSSQIDVPVERL